MQADKGRLNQLIGAIAIFILATGLVTANEFREPNRLPAGPEPNHAASALGPEPVHLYFGSPDGYYLISETRLIGKAGDPVEAARAIVEALIHGPRSRLARTLPTTTRLRALFITTENICVIDFETALRDAHPGGSRGELLTVYSIVNSLIVNIPSIKQVKLLLDGNDVDTLAGHMNLQRPIPANMLIIR